MDVALRCRCGKVQGVVHDVTPTRVNRVICCCADCQAFAHHLDRADLLDQRGGSDIVQVAPARIKIHSGHDAIAALRLTPGGLYRWHATCCGTPLGNSLTPTIPFLGFVIQAFDVPADKRDQVFGPAKGPIHEAEARLPTQPLGPWARVKLYGGTIALILGWRLTGQAWPHPYFERAPIRQIYPDIVVDPARREALRALCGPPAATT